MKNYSVSLFPAALYLGTVERTIPVLLRGNARLDYSRLKLERVVAPRGKERIAARFLRPLVLIIMYLLVTMIEKM